MVNSLDVAAKVILRWKNDKRCTCSAGTEPEALNIKCTKTFVLSTWVLPVCP
jgi:hypothetical protein